MSRYKPYPKYKESGVKWLGEVPEHWVIIQLRHLVFKISNGTTQQQVSWSEEKDIVPVSRIETISRGIIDYEKVGYIEYKPDLYHFLLNKNDILFSHINSLSMIGNCALYDMKSTLYHGMNLLRLQPNTKIYPSWFIYWLKSVLARQDIESVAKPAINQASISIDSLKSRYILMPPLQEQTTIANFLDRETAKIDTLIGKQERLIELLQEKRKALISHAVTKGLDPNVKMKESGVAWLGEVPEHWEVKKLKYIAHTQPSNIDKKSKDDEPDVLLCNYTDVYYNDFITNEIDFMKATATYDQINKFRLDVGDVIITKDSEGPEDIAIAAYVKETQDNLVCGYHLTLIKPTACVGSYLFRAINSTGLHDQFKVAANGITRYGLSVYGINSALLPAPPLAEQQQISDFLDIQTSRIDTLVEKAKQAIKLLKERRTALISAAVTGKIDVREAV